MRVAHIILVATILLFTKTLCASTEVALPVAGDLAPFKKSLATLSQGSQGWSDEFAAIKDGMLHLDSPLGVQAIDEAANYIKKMRTIAKDGIDDGDSHDLAAFKVNQAKLRLTLARSAITRAHTAALSGHDVTAAFLEKILELAAKVDSLSETAFPTPKSDATFDLAEGA